MPRVIGIDPGTLSIGLCGIEDGRLFLDRSIPTADALASPSVILDELSRAGAVDLIAGPSGYGLPLTNAQDLSEADLRLAFLSAEGEAGGIRGLTSLVRMLAASSLPLVLTPGVVHLASVPAHRKVNRVDMGTADKVCAAALAISELASRRGIAPHDVSAILLELGGAFSAAIAIDRGRIVDGVGGSSGPIGAHASGALDGEVAFLIGTISKNRLFHGGASTIAGMEDASFGELVDATTPRAQLALSAYVESALKAVAALIVSVPDARDVVVSGRAGTHPRVLTKITQGLARIAPSATVSSLAGFATEASRAAQGAALIADGLAGGRSAALVDTLGIRDATGTVVDHLHVITPAEALARLGLS
ncbi:MAG TPA: DUF1464 family protein [Vicinamibacterales bacterium]